MTYEAAITKAWGDLERHSRSKRHSVALLGDTYDVDLEGETVVSNSCNVPTKDYLTILILHYLIGSLRNAYLPSGEWISFKEIAGGEIYYPAFRESAVKPLLRKYGDKPEGLRGALERFKGKKIEVGDVGIEIATFPDIFVRVVLWRGDEEFGPEASILFDRNITKIYTMEDVVVFSRFITHSL
jgi:hypothetical protein